MFKIMSQCLLYISIIVLSACSHETLSFHTTKGKPIHFKDYQGKFIVLNYWSAMCKPCIHEIKVLNAFYQQHKNRDAVVIGVNYDGLSPKALKALVKQFDIHYPVMTEDPAKALRLGSIHYLPMTYILNSKGRELASLTGAQTIKMLETKLTSLHKA